MWVKACGPLNVHSSAGASSVLACSVFGAIDSNTPFLHGV